ncbi:UDP-N-acetylmuramate dehydrogenase [Candidatus Parcubacteria bacterium]|jgi:UDP-N-acetylmuramate dehydrogenase|nr:UDP-N-acetylmuramate dehydrogenase [Candidatus Parcubacteria bacterium]
MKIKEKVLLKDYTTFKIGGPAKHFVEVSTIEELQEALVWAKENKQQFLILGGGSNVIVSDSGFAGLVIKLDLQQLDFNDNKVTVGPGVMLAYLLNKSLAKDLVGLEFAAGIPGTVGGAIRGNAGTYGLAMSDVIVKIKYLDDDYTVQEMSKKKAGFSYRHSIFKTNSWIILEAELKLSTGNVDAAKKLVADRLQYRQDTQPNQPSAGCIFKNIRFEDVDLKDLKDRNVDVDKFAEHKKIPAGYLIEKMGLKGHVIGDAQISEKHANYIVNKGQATAEQVIIMISFIKQQIRDKYGIQLQEEVQIIV